MKITNKKENKYFVYEGNILMAAQPRLNTAIKYLKQDRKIMYGTPQNHKTDITNIINKIKFNKYENNKG